MDNFSMGIGSVLPPYERRVIPDWNLSPDKVLQITPQTGRVVRAISLGSADQSGGVQVVPPDVVGSESFPPVISPHSEFQYPIVQPFQIRPALQISGLAVGDTTTQHTLDLCVWYDLPCGGFPGRGPLYSTFSLPDTSPSGTASAAVWVMGRKRITVNMYNPSLGTITSAKVQCAFLTTGGVQWATIYSVAPVLGSSAIFEFNAGGSLAVGSPGGTGTVAQSSTIPSNVLAVRVLNTDGSGAGRSIVGSIEARDY